MDTRRAAGMALCLLLGAGVGARAQGKGSAPEVAYQPPVMRFDRPLSLLDAVRLTLQNDPQIKLQETSAVLQEGVAQELAGQFDWLLTASAKFDYNESELPLSQQQSEQRNRQKVEELIPRTQVLVDSLGQAIKNLQNPNVITAPRTVDLTAGVTDLYVKRDMTNLQLQLVTLSELIARAADPVLRLQLGNLYSDLLKTSIDALQGTFNEVKNLPDDLKKTREDMGDAPKDQLSKAANAQLNLSRQLRSGPVIGLFSTFDYSAQNFVGKDSTDPSKGGLGVPDLYKAQAGLKLTMPLKRGLGSDDVASQENAAKKEHQASLLVVKHQAGVSILNTMLAYWDLAAAAHEVEVSKTSVALQKDLLDVTRELIKAAEKPRSEESRSLAAYADAQARLEASLRRLNEAAVALARFMGVALDPAAPPPMPADGFPAAPDTILGEEAAVAALARTAIGQRYDRQASTIFDEAGRILARGSKLETRRLLNLEGSFFGTSVSEDNLSEMKRWVFRSGSGTLRFEVPFGNDQREGRWAQNEAQSRQRSIDAADLERNITLNVVRLTQSLRVAAQKLRRSEEAVRSYDQTIQDEQARFKAGDSTLVDTILTEQQTTAARFALVASQQEYASLLAQLRFELGLLSMAAEQGATPESLTTVPAQLQGR